ncbi:TetR/AcrR family transcriptional regulator [Agromyces sp. LHK192]|uniref:TetR/AcrR family transcriptional regulator n=1 Tax=Agromyces sp. LHK192 TaxID=2498704 RepID=UPI000FDBC362|nr:TetR/AcrR family transcriptional regulator [Agromyces sp. LHK192]
MASSTESRRTRKRPEERREEIVEAAATIALGEGLERVTLRAVADRLGVRPGLITHYYPAAEDLVTEAFGRAASVERERFFPHDGTPVERLARFLHHVESGASAPLAQLWLNARHLARFSPALAGVLEEQDALDRERLTAIIAAGGAAGDFDVADAEVASIRILLAIDGSGSYVNSGDEIDHPVRRSFAADVAEWSLGLPVGSLAWAVQRG